MSVKGRLQQFNEWGQKCLEMIGVCLFVFCLFVCMFVCLSVFCLSVCMFACLFVCLSVFDSLKWSKSIAVPVVAVCGRGLYCLLPIPLTEQLHFLPLLSNKNYPPSAASKVSIKSKSRVAGVLTQPPLNPRSPSFPQNPKHNSKCSS